MKQVLECCLLSLSLFLFFSCGKEEEGPIPTDRQVPIGVMEVSLSTRVSTRGVINTDIYKLGIFRTDAQGYPPQYDAPYSYDGVAGWTATTEILVDHRSASLYAYYPYQSVSFADKNNSTNFYLQRQVDITTGTITEGTPAAEGYVHNPNVEIASGNQVYEYLLPPQPLTDNKLTISVTVDGEVRTVTVTAFGGTLNAGGYYHVTLTINDVQIVPSANVTDNGYAADNTTIQNNTPSVV